MKKYRVTRYFDSYPVSTFVYVTQSKKRELNVMSVIKMTRDHILIIIYLYMEMKSLEVTLIELNDTDKI